MTWNFICLHLFTTAKIVRWQLKTYFWKFWLRSSSNDWSVMASEFRGIFLELNAYIIDNYMMIVWFFFLYWHPRLKCNVNCSIRITGDKIFIMIYTNNSKIYLNAFIYLIKKWGFLKLYKSLERKYYETICMWAQKEILKNNDR